MTIKNQYRQTDPDKRAEQAVVLYRRCLLRLQTLRKPA